jgi:BolA family transcriptional regulator, general stress-responsive regulator
LRFRLDLQQTTRLIAAMKVANSMRQKLEREFRPARLEIIDESHLHAGHAGAREGGESHFSVLIVSEAFAGLSRIDRHRRVHAALAEELNGGVHALAISAYAPNEQIH